MFEWVGTSLEAEDLSLRGSASSVASEETRSTEVGASELEQWVQSLGASAATKTRDVITTFSSPEGPKVGIDCCYRLEHSFELCGAQMELSLVVHGSLENGKATQHLYGPVDSRGKPISSFGLVEEVPHFWFLLTLRYSTTPLISSQLFFQRRFEQVVDYDRLGALSSLPTDLLLKLLGHLGLPPRSILPRADFEMLLPIG